MLQKVSRFAASTPAAIVILPLMIGVASVYGMAAGSVLAVTYLAAAVAGHMSLGTVGRFRTYISDARAAGELGQIMTGMIIFVVGLIVATVVNAVAASTGSNANIGSFTGAQDINDLLPTLFYISVMTAGLTVAGFGVVRGISGGFA